MKHEEIVAGFAHGKEHPLFKAVVAVIEAHREDHVGAGVAAVAERAVWRAMGEVEAMEILKESLEECVAEAEAAKR